MIFVFLTTRFVGFRNLKFSGESWYRKRQAILLSVIENIEDEDPIISISDEKTSKRFSVRAGFLVATSACILAMLVRFYLMQFDNYQLSMAWFQEYSVLIDLADQRWFNQDMIMTGQYAFMSFYGLITGITPEMALESFGLFQVFILCFIIFWFIDAMTNSLITIPLIGTIIFALFFNLAPVNVAQITHGKDTFMAMTFLLPAIVFIRKPWKLYRTNEKSYFHRMLVIFAAIALIDLFTLVVLIPPYFLVVSVFINKEYFKYYFKALGAYLLGAGLVLGTFAFAAYRNEVDFGVFFRSNLLSVTSTTTTGNMVLDYDSLVLTFQIVCLVGGVIMFFLFRKNPRKWASPLSFIIYVNVLVFYSKLGLDYFDRDLLNEISPILLACSLSLIFYIIYYYFNTEIKRIEIPDMISVPIIFITFFGCAYFSQQGLLKRGVKTGTISKNMLEAYQMVKDNYIPYGYAVVNANNMLPISKGSHNFLSYNDFVTSYPERDSIYFQFKNDEDFLVRNTEYIIPNSVLIFLYENVTNEFAAKVTINPEMNELVKLEIEALRAKGREVRLFFDKGNLKVYEVVNNPGEARIMELL